MEQEQFAKQKEIYGELADLFPALEKYKTEHNTVNLQKLCVEIAEFCKSVYASTENQEERKVFFAMLDKLRKL
jgi:hypothetical protein